MGRDCCLKRARHLEEAGRQEAGRRRRDPGSVHQSLRLGAVRGALPPSLSLLPPSSFSFPGKGEPRPGGRRQNPERRGCLGPRLMCFFLGGGGRRWSLSGPLALSAEGGVGACGGGPGLWCLGKVFNDCNGNWGE